MTAEKFQANILWFLPTHGDGRYLGTSTGGREVNFNYLRQVAQAADQLGYFGVLLPTGRSCEDSWVVASSVAPFTERLRYLVAVRPGLQSPSVAARMTATLDRITNGRLLINVVTGGDPVENKGDGIFLDHDALCGDARVPQRTAICCGQDSQLPGEQSASRTAVCCSSGAPLRRRFIRRIVRCRHRCRVDHVRNT